MLHFLPLTYTQQRKGRPCQQQRARPKPADPYYRSALIPKYSIIYVGALPILGLLLLQPLVKLLPALVCLLLAGPLAAQIPAAAPWQSAAPTPILQAMSVNGNGLQLTTPSGVWVSLSGYGGLGFGREQLSASPDNGQSWQQYATGYSFVHNQSGSRRTDFSALNAQQVWVLEDVYSATATGSTITTPRLSLLQAGTGGVSSLVTGQLPAGTMVAIRFFDATTGFGLVNTSGGTPATRMLYRTTDAAQTWTPVVLNPAIAAGGYWGAQQQLGSHFWLSVAGQLAHTPDAGQTWVISTPPQTLTQVAFRDAQNGLAYGGGAGRPLYRTTDGGSTWSPVAPTGPRRLNMLRAAPGAAGTYYSFGKTSLAGDQAGSAVSYDNGQTWQTLEATSLVDMAAVGPGGEVWAAYASYPNPSQTASDFTASTNMILHLTGTALAAAPPAAGQASLVYPNPTTGPVQLPAAGTYRQVAVYDATGRCCRTVALAPTETTLDLSSLETGLYMLRLSGGTAATQNQRLVLMRP